MGIASLRVISTHGPATVPARVMRKTAKLRLNQHSIRTFAVDAADQKRPEDDFQDLFVEARDCIEDARDSHETTYFDEDLEDAQAGVDAALKAWDGIISQLDEKAKTDLLRSQGLKIEQLKAELGQVLELAAEH